MTHTSEQCHITDEPAHVLTAMLCGCCCVFCSWPLYLCLSVCPVNGYSPSTNGNLMADVFWVNYGTLDDYEFLDRHGFNMTGKIAIARSVASHPATHSPQRQCTNGSDEQHRCLAEQSALRYAID